MSTLPAIIPGMKPSDFAVIMQQELDNNAHKGDFNKWEPTRGELVLDIDHHIAKLRWAILNNENADIREYAADTGNLLMKLVEQFGWTRKSNDPLTDGFPYS